MRLSDKLARKAWGGPRSVWRCGSMQMSISITDKPNAHGEENEPGKGEARPSELPRHNQTDDGKYDRSYGKQRAKSNDENRGPWR